MNERTHPHVSSAAPTRPGRGLSRAAVGVVAATAVMATGSGLAGAVPSLPPDPHAVVTDQCSSALGPEVVVVYTNPTGEGDAHFQTVLDGVPQAAVTVAPGAQEVREFPVAEGSSPLVDITAELGFHVQVTRGPMNCWDMSKWVGFVCTDQGPRVLVQGTNTGALHDTLDIFRDGVQWGAFGIDAGEGFSYSVPVTEDASYDVKVVPGHSGWSSITGHANCEEPAPAEDPDPQPIDEPTTTSTTLPPAEVQSAGASPAAASVTAPHFTG